jgi:hypothetical protein
MGWLDILADSVDVILTTTSTAKKYSAIQSTLSRVLSVAPSRPSGRSVVAALRARGVSVANQAFRDMYRNAIDLEEYKQRQAGSFSTEIPTPAEIPEGSLTQRRKYTYQFRIQVFDYSTGGWRMKPFRYTTNNLLSSADAYTEFQKQFGQDLLNEGADLNKASFDWLKKRPEGL